MNYMLTEDELSNAIIYTHYACNSRYNFAWISSNKSTTTLYCNWIKSSLFIYQQWADDNRLWLVRKKRSCFASCVYILWSVSSAVVIEHACTMLWRVRLVAIEPGMCTCWDLAVTGNCLIHTSQENNSSCASFLSVVIRVVNV